VAAVPLNGVLVATVVAVVVATVTVGVVEAAAVEDASFVAGMTGCGAGVLAVVAALFVEGTTEASGA
jgi:hypothetical protein